MKSMVSAKKLTEGIKALQIKTFLGVPDSTLKNFTEYLEKTEKEHHYVTADEGAAIGMAVGEYLATGRSACVYMQNSGLGNAVNPLTSLVHEEVYQIPMLLVVGWRGRPGIHDEPQHKFMGRITVKLLELLEIAYEVIDPETTEEDLEQIFKHAREVIQKQKAFAIVVSQNSLEKEIGWKFINTNSVKREEAIAKILEWKQEEDIVVSTTGKISREVYEQSEKLFGNHDRAFLTVGGMGHASMIAMGIAENKKEKRVICMDGDGAILMHTGSLAFIGAHKPKNYLHICLNNQCHESVGGMPTDAQDLSYAKLAKVSGYENVYVVESLQELDSVLNKLEEGKLTFIEIKVSVGSRDDLGRPKEKAIENRIRFMEKNDSYEEAEAL